MSNLKFNKNIFSAFEQFSCNNDINSLEHLLDVLNARSSRSIIDKFNHNCIPTHIFTWRKNDYTKVLTIDMKKVTTGFKFNLDIEENGKMFLSEGKDTMRTPLPAYELNNLGYYTKNIIKELLRTITCEDCTVQDMFNSFEKFLDYDVSHYEIEEIENEHDRYLVKTFGTAPHSGEICSIQTEPFYVKDELRIEGGFTLLIGKKILDEDENKTVRYFNVYYQNRIITNREFMNDPIEWYSYFDEEQDKWIIPEDESCYGYREQFEAILNKYADKQYAFFYHSMNDEIHCYFDTTNSPHIWLRQYGTNKITDQINFNKTIEFSNLDFNETWGSEMLEAESQVIEHFETD